MDIEGITDDQIKAYIAGGGRTCPLCEGNVLSHSNNELVLGTIYRDMTCDACKAEWTACYEVDRILDYDLPED
jgi:hypothetical protein